MKFKSLSTILVSLLLVSVMACSSSSEQEVQQAISNTKAEFAPDSRVALFDIEATAGNGGWILKGETTLAAAKTALMDSMAALNVNVTDSISVLPEADLQDKTLGIINNSVANLRSRPSHPAQLVTQATLGMPVEVLKKRGSWYLVQAPDDYLGWVDYGGLHRMNKQTYDNWASASKIIYLDTYGFAYEEPNSNSGKVSDLVSGSILNVTGTSGDYYQVSYPDGRTGYVNRTEARSFEDWKASVEASQNRLVETAKSMTGAPYLWGGTSSKGMDCSGFTKTIYSLV
ncbi:MAG: SH3 domain-containing protein [Fodinibius sp.]|nr:SH3 domain-containing protein [Fodinibius sp.]